jgi:pentapeptide MXKDX repeat protein
MSKIWRVMAGAVVFVALSLAVVGCGASSSRTKTEPMGTAKMSGDKMSTGKMNDGNMSGDKMAPGKMSGDKMSTGKMEK